MCVALPGVVIEKREKDAIVDFNGNKVVAMSGLVDVAEGDYCLVHAGCILQKLSEKEAKEMTELFNELESVGENGN